MYRLSSANALLQDVAPSILRSYSTRHSPHSLAYHEQEHHALDATNPKHLLRHLLRECTYLPDPTSRNYFKEHILHRFRTYSATSIASSSVLKARIPFKLREGKKALLTLRKANGGFFLQVKKVLNHTYGRTGRRGRLLMEPLKRSVVSDAEVSDVVSRVLAKHPTILQAGISDQIPHLTPPVEKLYLEQQHRSRSLDKSLRLGKTKGPEIAHLNSWQRPLPACRVKNQTKRWYAQTLSKLMPPLPVKEWAVLQGLSNGSIRWHAAQQNQRRVMVGMCTADVDLRSLKMGLGLAATQTPPSTGGRKQPHRVTNRFMRRRWAEVLANTPCLNLDEPSGQWSVNWNREMPFARGKQVLNSLRTALAEDNQ